MIATTAPLACEHVANESGKLRAEAANLRKAADAAKKAAMDLNNAAINVSDIAWHEVQRQVSELESLAATLNGWARQVSDKH